MKHTTSQILFRYWNEVRMGRIAPRRFDIEPARISAILADTMLLERDELGRYHFRLAGTRICERFSTELRGIDFLDLWDDQARGQVAEALRQVSEMGSAAVLTFDAISIDGLSTELEAIVLPLLHTRETIDRYLGAVSCEAPPVWFGHVPIARLELGDCRTLWPDGKPHSVIASLGRQAPFRTDIKDARIVRSERRQFRVLEGGRNSRGDDKT
jgi:hypothetical protein